MKVFVRYRNTKRCAALAIGEWHQVNLRDGEIATLVAAGDVDVRLDDPRPAGRLVTLSRRLVITRGGMPADWSST